MIVVSGRDFRANQSKYFGFAQSGEDVVVKARYGAWRVVPVAKDEALTCKRDLAIELRGALMEAKAAMEGKRKMNTLTNLINEL